MRKKIVLLLFIAVLFTACTKYTFVNIDECCTTCDENGKDTTLVSYCFNSPEIVSQGTMLKSSPVAASLYAYNYFNSQFVIKEDLTSGSTNRSEFTNPYTQQVIGQFCIDWLKIGYNSFFLVTTDKAIESGFGAGKVNNVAGEHTPIFPSNITGMGLTSGTVIVDTSSYMTPCDIYMIRSTLKFNIDALQEHNVRYTFTCSDNVGTPDPILMSGGYTFDTFVVNHTTSFIRPSWKVKTHSTVSFVMIIQQGENTILNGKVVHPEGAGNTGFITIYDNDYNTGQNFTLKYVKEIKHNGTWIAEPEQTLSAPDMNRWIYGGVERRIIFLKGTPPNDSTGEGCVTVSCVGQDVVSQDVTIN